MTQQTERNVTI